MAIVLGALPRSTQYFVRPLSFALTQTPPLGGPELRLDRLGSRWAVEVEVPAVAYAGCGAGLAVDLARGQTEPVVLAIPEPGMPVVDYGAPLVNGSGQAGGSLAIDGLSAGRVIPKGKFISILTGGQRFLHQVAAEVEADGAGQATLGLWPLLRRIPANNAVVEITAPKIEGFVQLGLRWAPRSIGALGVAFTIQERE